MQLRADQEREILLMQARAHHSLLLIEERERQRDLGSQGRLGGLIHFVRYFWHVLEPKRPLAEGPVLFAMILHLEAVSRGEITRLLINVSPGSMKSLLVNVFWPCWEWSAGEMASNRYLSFSYAAQLTERDNGKCRDVLRSLEFRDLWGREFKLVEDGKIKLANNHTGWKIASSVRGVSTGERADRILLDDPHNVKEQESEAIRSETVRWFKEAMSNRLNDMDESAIIVIMQRVHEEDVSGAILDEEAPMDYDHLCIRNEYSPEYHKVPTSIGWLDWRKEDGELAWPERMSVEATAREKIRIGPFAYAGQYMQDPEPRGGGIFKRSWWQVYPLIPKGHPKLKEGTPVYMPHYIVASVDPAFTKDDENDPSGLTVWGVFVDEDGYNKCALLHAWQKRLELHGEEVGPQKEGETEAMYISRAKLKWGLVEWLAHECKHKQVDLLLVENKASGLDVFSEIRRLHRREKWAVQLIDPGNLDKRSRAYSVQHLFADGTIYAPTRDWAEKTISQFAKFRGLSGDSDHLVDSGTQAIRWLRDTGMLLRREEKLEEDRNAAEYKRVIPPLYSEV